MYLADATIKQYLHSGKIQITPTVKPENIRSVGVRVHLAGKLLVPRPGHIDLSSPTHLEYDNITIGNEGYTLKPGDFILASTIEKIKTARNILTFIDGRSTVARLGLTIHVTAGVVDGNNDEARAITLEVKNLGVHSIILHAGYPIGQVLFAQLSEEVEQASQSQYQGQSGAEPPNLDFKTGIDT